MNTAAITTPSTLSPFTQDLKQPQPKQQTVKEAIAANVQALIEQLEQGHSEGTHRLPHSDGTLSQLQLWQHVLEIARQKPRRDPRCWTPCLESVWPQGQKRGAGHSHPSSCDWRSPQEGCRNRRRVIAIRTETILFGFRSVYVFDVSQTEGKDLPEMSERVSRAMLAEYRERLVDFIALPGHPA